MNALVTGGAGFIGSELVRQLEQTGARVRVLDNFSTGRRANLEGTAAEVVEADIRDAAAVRHAIEGIDHVFHLACVGVRRSLHSPREAHEVNASGTLAMLEAAVAARVARFLHVSTAEVYGAATSVPISESLPTFPATPYGASKLAGEAYARAWYETYGFPVTVIRPFNAYGPRCHHEGDSGEVIPKFLLRAWAGMPVVVFGDGLQTRDFTYVSDTARGLIAAAKSPATAGGTFNLGSGRETSILDLARLTGAAELIHAEPRPGDVRRLVCDASRARDTFGFAPTITLEDGLTRLRQWYEQQRVAPEILLRDDVVYNWRCDASPSQPPLA